MSTSFQFNITFAARDFSRAMGKLNSGIPQIPSSGVAYHHEAYLKRRDLPIWPHRADIIQTIAANQVGVFALKVN